MGKVVTALFNSLKGPVTGLVTGGGRGAIEGLSNLATAFIGGPSAVLLSTATRVISAVSARGPSTQDASPSLTRQAVGNSFIVYGKRRVGGLLIFFHPRSVGKEHWRYFVIAVAGHRCKGVTRWWLGDQEVAVDGTGKVTSGKYAGNAWLDFYRGTEDQQAHPTFVAETAGKWTVDHRGRGTALIYARFRMTDEVAQAGMPNITAEIEGKDDVLDPRDDSRGYTRNAALVFYDWMAMPREEGGFGCYDDEIDWDWVAAQANVCDEMVPTPAGPEPRYAFDSYITTGAAPSEIRDTFITCCAGAFTYSSGKMLMRPGYYVPPSATLSEDDVAAPLTVPLLREGDQTATEVSGTFVDPTSLYQGRDVPTRAVATDDVRQASYDLPHVTSIFQGQRVLEVYLRKSLAERRVTWPMNIMGIAISVLDTVQCGTDRYGLSNYAFQVVGWGLAQDFSVTLQLDETGPDLFEFDPASYLEPGAVPLLASANPIDDRPARAAHVLVSQSAPYPVNSDVDSIMVAAFSGVIDDGRAIDFPAGAIDGLAPATSYRLFWRLSTSAYVAAVDPAFAEAADSDLVFIGSISTANEDGTGYPDTPTPPGGWGGNGSGGNCPTEDMPFLLANADRTSPGFEIPAGSVTTDDWAWTQHEVTGEWGAFRVTAVSKHRSAVVLAWAGHLPRALDGYPTVDLRASPDHRIGGAPWRYLREIGRPDGEATVVRITVAGAATYVVAGVLSHNAKQVSEPQP